MSRFARVLATTVLLALAGIPAALTATPVRAEAATPVATNEPSYQAAARVFSDPHGCLSYELPATPPAVSPWAKGRACATQFLSYQETIDGARFLAQRFPDFVSVIRLDQAYDNPNFKSAGIPRKVVIEDGTPKALGRDRRPLYLIKITDRTSDIPEPKRLHFVYGLSIHGIERAGLEGGIRAAEDLVTWAACEREEVAADTPACAVEGPFPKEIVEGETERPVPTAGDALERSVIYLHLANPDGWARGQVDPVELRDGSPNLNYTPGVFFQRYNGNGVDMNRDWPGEGYVYRPYSPGSEPETQAFAHVLREIRKTISPDGPLGQRFAGGIDLHGMITANAFSFTLLGAGERDYRKNNSTVDQALRTWEDQTARLTWSPYIADSTGDGEPDGPCINEPGFGGNIPACVADQWGTVIDTLGYQVSGALADWYENDAIGLGAVGIDNEMYTSHLAPNNIFEPALEQTHIDGNKGLIYSQIASMLTEQDEDFILEPGGKIGYVDNPVRIEHEGDERPQNPGFPAQNDIDVLIPCQSDGPQNLDAALPCKEPGVEFQMDGIEPTLEFDVHGPDRGIWNGGITVTVTRPNALGMSDGNFPFLFLERFEEEDGEWETVARDFNQSILYLQAGQIVTANDPIPGRWRVRFDLPSAMPARVKVDFNRVTAEESPGQAAFSASSMDFFEDMNKYIEDRDLRAEAVAVDDVIADPASLDRFDSLVVVNRIGRRAFLTGQLGLSAAEADAYLAALRSYAERGGNLVLTDGALDAAQRAGIVAQGSVSEGVAGQGRGLAARYQFDVPDRGDVCNEDPLLADVCLPGTAGGTTRVAVEPTPLGYSPDGTLDTGIDDGDPVARMHQWWVDRDAWQSDCGKEDPAECTASTFLGAGAGQTAIGERAAGDGVVRIAGALFPDPNFGPGAPRDMRFGLASYALSFSAWQIFLNLVDYQRPELPDADPAPARIALSVPPRREWKGSEATLSATLADEEGGDALAGRTVRFLIDGEPVAVATTGAGGVAEASISDGLDGKSVVGAAFDGDATHEPASVEARYHPGRGISAESD
jgi:hypothetical protein